MDQRNFRAVLIIAAAAALLWSQGEAAVPAAHDVAVAIDGPDGPFWAGQVTADPGHAFGALRAASLAGNFSVDWTGQGAGIFVRAINGWGSAGGAGWCFQVDDGSGMADSPVGAGATVIEDGWSVRWYWVSNGCDRF